MNPFEAPGQVFVSQIGARQHYDVARMCQRASCLAQLDTDFWAPTSQLANNMVAKAGGAFAVRAAGRGHSAIAASKVHSRPLAALYWSLRLRGVRSRRRAYALYAEQGAAFAKAAARRLAATNFDTYFGFTSGALEALVEARRLGKRAVLDVIAPDELEDEIIQQERVKFLGWEHNWQPLPARYVERIKAERAAADCVIVNSQWARQAMIRAGVLAEKIGVVPLSYTAPGPDTARPDRPIGARLRVLWLSTLCLRKGIQYVIEAARNLSRYPVDFTLAGPTTIDLTRAQLPENCRYIGAVARTQAEAVWNSHDIYVLPTLSDGFAITQIEAMAHGLPVITTARCGDVVQDGRNGLIVEAGSAPALCNAIIKIFDGEFDHQAASRRAFERARAYTPDAVWPALREALTLKSPLAASRRAS